jgi:tetratricopeptide (TPR) repeat protein
MPTIITAYRTSSPADFLIGWLHILHSLSNDSDKFNYKGVRVLFLILLSVFVIKTALFADAIDQTKDQLAVPPKVTFSKVDFLKKLSTTLSTGTPDQALVLFDSLPSDASVSTDLSVLKASLLLSAGRSKEAAALADQLQQKEPKNISVLTLSMMIAKKNDDKTKKASLIKLILAIDPKNADANVELGGEQALGHHYALARDYYGKALESDPENLNALFGYGQMSYYIEKDDDAKKSFEKMIEVDPQNALAYAYLGKLESENHSYLAAKEYINKAIALDPSNTDFYLDLGTYCRFLGKYSDAENAWKKAVETDPDYFLGYAYLAGIYDEENKFDEALDAYRKVIEKNSKYYYAYESLGIFAWHSGNYTEARQAFEKARQMNQDNISYPLMIAACYMKEGDSVNCKKFTEEVMKKQDKTTLEYQMVRMYHDKGGDGAVAVKIQDEENRTKRGKMLYYLALYFDITGKQSLAQKYYSQVVEMKSPLFFEYRLAEWSSKPE